MFQCWPIKLCSSAGPCYIIPAGRCRLYFVFTIPLNWTGFGSNKPDDKKPPPAGNAVHITCSTTADNLRMRLTALNPPFTFSVLYVHPASRLRHIYVIKKTSQFLLNFCNKMMSAVESPLRLYPNSDDFTLDNKMLTNNNAMITFRAGLREATLQ